MYKIEGPLCFMTCDVGLEPVFEVYQINPDGSTTYIINQRPRYCPTAEEITSAKVSELKAEFLDKQLWQFISLDEWLESELKKEKDTK